MTATLASKLRELPKARRTRVTARAAILEAEELSLRALRQAQKLTQERMAEKLGMAQGGISRLEKRKDVLLSTLNQYVEAMGGELRVTVEFPDRPAVRLANLAYDSPTKSSAKPHRRKIASAV